MTAQPETKMGQARSLRDTLVALCHPVLFLVALAVQVQAADTPDPILRAMRAELDRSHLLTFAGLESPYFVETDVDDVVSFSAAATLGGLLSAQHGHFRSPRVEVRVGNYKFDNTNYVGSGYNYGSNYDVNRLPLENNYELLRRYLWLGIDRAYKSAVESIARKRAALKNVSIGEQPDDFAAAEPLHHIEPVTAALFDEEGLKKRVRALSAIFAKYPAVRNSAVDFSGIHDIHYKATTEGAEIRYQEYVSYVRARAVSQAPDGMLLRDALEFHSGRPGVIQSEAEMTRAITKLAENVVALAAAPMGEGYNGPVVFEPEAAAQIFAQVIGKNLALTRRPVMEPGRPMGFPTSELEGRFGARILPDWMDIVDDPTQSEWSGHSLYGKYSVDEDGVAPKPLSLVEKGVLKNFLLTRLPMRNFKGSNGRARLPGGYGSNEAVFSNLFVRASETVAPAELKRKMIEICNTRNKPYGILIRKMDFPSSATIDELRRLLAGSANSGGSSRSAAIPILAYRVYPDGREELVRGLRFRGFNARSFKDILAASNESVVFDFLDNGYPLALMGASGSVAQCSVIAPGVLIDDLEMERVEEEFPKIPIVPPPS